MSSRPDLDRSIAEWLVAEAPDRAPERLLAASRDRIQTTRQRRAWWPAWRIPPMSNTVRLILATTTVVVTALIGYKLLIAPNVGSPSLAAPDLTGTLTLVDQGAWPALQVGADCEGEGGFSDITEGTQVVVTNEAGDIIATGSLGPGRFVTTSAIGTSSLLRVCVFDIAVPDVPDAEFYTVEVSPRGAFNYSRMVEVSHGGTIDYSRAELDNMDWHVSLVVR